MQEAILAHVTRSTAYCTQRAPTASVDASPTCTTSNTTTPNFCKPFTIYLAERCTNWAQQRSNHVTHKVGNTHAVRNSCTRATVTIVFGHNRFLIHAHAHWDENTSVKRKTNKETLNKHACHLTKTCPHSEDMNSRLVFHFPRSAQVTEITSSLCRILEEQFETFDTRAIFACYQFQSRLHIFLGVCKSLTIPHLTVETIQLTTSTIVLRSDPTKRMTHSSCVNLLAVPTLERVCLPVTNFSQTFRFHTESDAFAKNFLLVSICQLQSRF